MPAKWRFETAEELLARLGDIPPERVRAVPPPGTATKWHLIRFRGPGQYELIDRAVVAKGLSPFRGYVVGQLAVRLGNAGRRRGALFGPGAWVELSPGVVRNPDVSLIPWKHLPGGRIPLVQIGRIPPALAVEIVGPANTRKEVQIKRAEYFRGGVQLVWIIDPASRTAEAYTGPDAATAIPADGALTGGAVLPGFAVPLADLFVDLPPVPAPAKKTKGKKK